MRVLAACFALVVTCTVKGAEPDNERVKNLLKSEYYTVTWGKVSAFEAEAELESGYGIGHGGNLEWLRFLPGKDGVDVLSIRFDGKKPYKSKWPPDRAPVTVKSTRMKADAYTALMRDLSLVGAAELKPVERKAYYSTGDFWVQARLFTNKKSSLDLNWVGYKNSRDELNFAKPWAAVLLAQEAIKDLDFKNHPLTTAERTWASAKFARDWKAFLSGEDYWWVRERYIETIGTVGDESAFPVLREILAADPPKGEPREDSDGQCVYLAINAVTRLT
jgi:hypothetical protein